MPPTAETAPTRGGARKPAGPSNVFQVAAVPTVGAAVTVGTEGSGGDVAIHFMTTQGDLQIDSSPGTGGKGGAKGTDGKPGC